MALSDQQIQFLHSTVVGVSTKSPTLKNSTIYDKKTGQTYKVINRTPGNPNSDDVTQAIAVAPCDPSGKNVDYSQTAIVVAGTQSDNPMSGVNAGIAAWTDGGLTPQTHDIRNFYNSTMKKLENKPNGYISNMSGFSQSGPAVAKVACEQRVPHITNFDDWGSISSAVNPRAVIASISGFGKNRFLTDDDIDYLNKHARIYLDSKRTLTIIDGGFGQVPYGKQFVVQSSVGKKITDISDHNSQFAKIKGNGLDINWYIRNNKFCSGMTYDQALKIAKYKARKAKSLSLDPTTWVDSTDYKKHLEDYVRTYGPFAPDNPAEQLLKGFNKDIKSYKGQLKSASGGKAISLRSDLVKAVAGKASLQAEEYARDVKETLESEKRRLESDIQEVRHQAYQIARHLQTWEIESLLSQFSMSTCWDAGVESTTLEEVAEYQKELTTFSEKLSAAADKIVAVDRESAQLFN